MTLKITEEKTKNMFSKDLKAGEIFSFLNYDENKTYAFMKTDEGVVRLNDGMYFSNESYLYATHIVDKIYQNTELILK